MNPRLIAARMVNEVTDGHSLTECFDHHLPNLPDPRDRALVQAICYGVCRWYARLDVILSFLLQKPMKAKDSDVHALLLVGLYQLIDMRVPPHAAVSETVNAAEKIKNKPWARGLVNAILREYLRSKDNMAEEIAQDEEAHYAHPIWWITAIKRAWPKHWESILMANNVHPPFSLRVNQQKTSRDDYVAQLDHARVIPETQSGILLEEAVAVETLPGFAEGNVSVQDGAAQLAAELLELAPGQRVLDACSAPGGKLVHILECQPNVETCVAVEKDAKRMVSVKENLLRQGMQATCIVADVADTAAWWDGQLFDRILLDAPCSASGVIRRHPDIKLLREPTDIKALAKEQLHLLEALWPLLKTGGMLLYATCSIFPEENVEVVKRFLAAHPDAHDRPIAAEWGVVCDVGRQILPGMHDMDGFYYSKLLKE